MNPVTPHANDLAAAVARYWWYHCIELAPGVVTPGDERFVPICDFIAKHTADVPFRGKSVLDVGSRDCLHALRMEAAGAARVVAIDNDLSLGARDLVLPHFGSKIEMRPQNLYDLTDREVFDIATLYGALYHLRHPHLGLRRCVDALTPGGLLLIETALVSAPALGDLELMYCPGEEASPYDPTSCSFFTESALHTALVSLGCVALRRPAYLLDACTTTCVHFARPTLTISRAFLMYQKTHHAPHDYWEGKHTHHSA